MPCFQVRSAAQPASFALQVEVCGKNDLWWSVAAAALAAAAPPSSDLLGCFIDASATCLPTSTDDVAKSAGALLSDVCQHLTVGDDLLPRLRDCARQLPPGMKRTTLLRKVEIKLQH